MDPRLVLLEFDSFLVDRELELEAVVIGGTALVLLGVIDRSTRDCDVLAPPLSEAVRAAAAEFAAEKRRTGLALADDWLNNGPASLTESLPAGWETRVEPLLHGRALRLAVLGRLDLLRTKLFALCDRQLDLADCIALAPTAAELATVMPWLEAQDGHPDWPDHVRRVAQDLARRLRHGI